MGTISDKLTYLNTTKSQLKDMINYGLDDNNKITSSTTFRNYVTSIFNAFLEALRTPDTLFTNLPKITGSGSQITLNDTANAPMRITLGASELTQDGTPTPSSPQDIHTISGSNTISVCGKNLYDGSRLNTYFDSSKNFITYTNCNTTRFIPAKEGDIFTISSEVNSGGIVIASFDENYNCLLRSAVSGKLLTHTCPVGTKYIIGSNYIGMTTNTQLEIGNTDTTYEAFNGADYEVNLGGQNLFDFENAMWFPANYGSGIKQENSIYVKCSSSSQWGQIRLPSVNINLKPSTTYTFSARVINTNSTGGASVGVSGQLNSTGSSINGNKVLSGNTSYVTFTTPSSLVTDINNSNLYLCPRETEKEATFDQIQLVEGSTLLSYKEYVETPVEYCKIGNYEDKFIRTSGKNLYEPTNIEQGWINTSGEQTTNSSRTRSKNYIEVESSTSYYLSSLGITNSENWWVHFYDANKNWLSYFSATDMTNNNNVFTTPNNCKYIKCAIAVQDNTINNVMLAQRSSATEYEPYGSNEWYIKKNIGKVVLDGSENDWTWADTNKYNVAISGIGTQDALCNYFTYFQYVSDASTPSGTFSVNASKTVFGFVDKTVGSLTNFKTWLSTHNTIVYYVLATPTYTKITGTLANQLENVYQKMLSYTGQTNISQVNNDLSFVINASALEEL